MPFYNVAAFLCGKETDRKGLKIDLSNAYSYNQCTVLNFDDAPKGHMLVTQNLTEEDAVFIADVFKAKGLIYIEFDYNNFAATHSTYIPGMVDGLMQLNSRQKFDYDVINAVGLLIDALTEAHIPWPHMPIVFEQLSARVMSSFFGDKLLAESLFTELSPFERFLRRAGLFEPDRIREYEEKFEKMKEDLAKTVRPKKMKLSSPKASLIDNMGDRDRRYKEFKKICHKNGLCVFKDLYEKYYLGLGEENHGR